MVFLVNVSIKMPYLALVCKNVNLFFAVFGIILCGSAYNMYILGKLYVSGFFWDEEDIHEISCSFIEKIRIKGFSLFVDMQSLLSVNPVMSSIIRLQTEVRNEIFKSE